MMIPPARQNCNCSNDVFSLPTACMSAGRPFFFVPAEKEKMFAPLDHCPKYEYNIIGRLRDMGELLWQQKQKKNMATRVFPL